MYVANIVNKSEDELLAESFSELVRKNTALIQRAAAKVTKSISICGRLKKSQYDIDDRIQEGLAYAWLWYKRYTQNRLQSESVNPETWLYYKILSGAGNFSRKESTKRVTFITTGKEDSVGMGDYSEYNRADDVIYDFDKDDDLELMAKNIVTLPDKERALVVSFLNCGCMSRKMFRELNIKNNYNNISDLQHSLELLKLKIQFGKDESILRRARDYNFCLAIDFAINNSKKSLTSIPMKTDYNGHEYGTNKFNIFKSCFEVVKNVARYINIADKKIVDITPIDLDLLIDKLQMSDYSEAGLTKIDYRRRLRFVMERLVNMGVIEQNPVAFRSQYGLKKIQGALIGKTARGQDKRALDVVEKFADVYYPLVQKSTDGQVIQYYKSLAELKAKGFHYSNITQQMSGRSAHAYGCYWEYANPDDAINYLREHDTDYDYAEQIKSNVVEFNPNRFVVRRDVRYDRKNGGYIKVNIDENNKIVRLYPTNKIYQFTKAGELVKIFNNVKDAVNAGYKENSLRSSIDRQSYCGYFWSHKEKFSETIFFNRKSPEAYLYKKIEQLDADGRVIAVFQSIKSAESPTVRIPTLSLALRKHKRTGQPGYYSGYYWRYAGEDFKVEAKTRKYQFKDRPAKAYMPPVQQMVQQDSVSTSVQRMMARINQLQKEIEMSEKKSEEAIMRFLKFNGKNSA